MVANTTIATSKCNQIHNLIQNSGLHFVINQTPFSSYITIRKKIIPQHSDRPNCDGETLVDKAATNAEIEECTKKYNDLLALHKRLSKNNEDVKEAFENEVEEHKGTIEDNKKLSDQVSRLDKEISFTNHENEQLNSKLLDKVEEHA